MDTATIIQRLGGSGKAAEICGVQSQAVSLWKRAGIPARHWLPLVRYARENDIGGIDHDALYAAYCMHKAAAQ